MLLLLVQQPFATAGEPKPRAPFRYVWGSAYHILPETHNQESGYFSLCEGLNGRVYVGTAKYGVNSFLVEFDPRTERQRIVIDTHRLCGVSATGFRAQAKIHTRNFVGPSGIIYVGSKQGYPQKGENPWSYPGGYLMTYDPSTDRARCLGQLPYHGHGVGDVVADEGRQLLYVVTQEDNYRDHLWATYHLRTKEHRLLGPRLCLYATTLLDKRGRAFALTHDYKLARFDPDRNELMVRPIRLREKRFNPAADVPLGARVPTWILNRDGRTAYLIMMTEPTLYEMDLSQEGAVVRAISRGHMIKAERPTDCRCALSMGPEGKVYAAIRVKNTTGFGGSHLHHLVRFDPVAKRMEDLGVLAVRNPDYFDFGPGPDGKRKPWSHGFGKLPDGTLVPQVVHMGLTVGRDGTVYVLCLYPFTLLKIDAFRLPPGAPRPAQGSR